LFFRKWVIGDYLFPDFFLSQKKLISKLSGVADKTLDWKCNDEKVSPK